MSGVVTETSQGSSANAAPALTGESGKRLWHAGTLVYTTGGLVVLFCWLLFGDFALSMRDRSVGQSVQLLLKKFNTSDTAMVILMTALAPAISIFLTPIIGYKSDRYRSRWGRRIPFLLVPTPIAALSMIGVAFCPHLAISLNHALGERSPGVSACFLGMFVLFWTMYDIASITAAAVLGGLFNDVVPRPVLGRFFGLFRAISLLAGIIFNKWIYGKAEDHFVAIFVTIGLIYAIGFMVMCLRVKEGSYPPPEPITNDHRAGGFFAAIEVYLKECFAEPYYLWVFAAMLLATITFIPFNAFSVFYQKSINMTDQRFGDLVGNSYIVSLLIAYPLGWLVDRFHPLRVGLAAQMLYAASVFYGALFVRDTKTFAIALVAHTILSGTYFTATASLGQALFPRLKFGQYASAALLVSSLGTIALSLVLGPILDFSGHMYRLTFVAGLILCLTTIVLMLVVYRKFMALGGPKHYVPPGSNEDVKAAGFAEVVQPKKET